MILGTESKPSNDEMYLLSDMAYSLSSLIRYSLGRILSFTVHSVVCEKVSLEYMNFVGYIVWHGYSFPTVTSYLCSFQNSMYTKFCTVLSLFQKKEEGKQYNIISFPTLLFCAITILWLLYNLYFHIVSKQNVVFLQGKIFICIFKDNDLPYVQI